MSRMRTIEQTFQYTKEKDKNSALSLNAIRRLVISGEIPSIKSGCKYLINLDLLDEYLQCKTEGKNYKHTKEESVKPNDRI